MFVGRTNEYVSHDIIEFAHNKGVNFFDTADVYNQGLSEKIVDKALKHDRNK